MGEISKVDVGPKGHLYFNLRDEKENSMISCAMWKSRYDYFSVELKEGMKVIVAGNPEIYSVTGRLSFIVSSLELSGEGELKKEYNRLREKFKEEGLFEIERKRKIPDYITKIGVITSLKGAVIADFSNNLGKYGFKVKMIDARVEGQEAVSDIIKAINILKKEDIEVLVIMRGGGTLENLAPMMPFNNEFIIREVVNFPVPVITAIGHHKDTPLLSMVSDLNVSTPTASAMEIKKSWDKLSLFIDREKREIIYNYQNLINIQKENIKKIEEIIKNYKDIFLERYKKIENNFRESISVFKNSLINVNLKIISYKEKVLYNFKKVIENNREKIKSVEKIILSNNPERQLNLGYSITRINGKIIKSIEKLKKEDIIDISLKDGEVRSEIKDIRKN